MTQEIGDRYCDQCGEKIRPRQEDTRLEEGELDFCDEDCWNEYVKIHGR